MTNHWPRKRNAIFQFWFVMTAATFLPPEFCSVLFIFFIAAAKLHNHINFNDYSIRAVTPFIIIIILGILNSSGHPIPDVFKDLWYCSLPILSLLSGWALADGWPSEDLQKHIARFGACVSIFFLIKAGGILLFEPALFDNKYLWRQALGSCNLITIWGLFAALSLLSKHSLSRANRGFLFTVVLLNFIAQIISDSRTALILFLSGAFLVFIPSWIYQRRRLYWTTLITGTGIIIALLLSGNGDPTTTLGRYQNILWEQFSFSFSDQQDANVKYRAFETLAAIRTVMLGTWWDQIVGHGFGKMVDLDFLFILGEPGNQSDYQFIPILHNGYLYIMVKTGFLGTLLYVVFLAKSFKAFLMAKTIDALRYWQRIGVTIVIGTLLGTFVIAGPFGKGSFFTTFMVLGFAMRYCFSSRIGKSTIVNV